MKCEFCNGQGTTYQPQFNTASGIYPCPECNGTGIAYCCEGAPRQLQNGVPVIDPMTGSGLARNMSAYRRDDD